MRPSRSILMLLASTMVAARGVDVRDLKKLKMMRLKPRQTATTIIATTEDIVGTISSSTSTSETSLTSPASTTLEDEPTTTTSSSSSSETTTTFTSSTSSTTSTSSTPSPSSTSSEEELSTSLSEADGETTPTPPPSSTPTPSSNDESVTTTPLPDTDTTTPTPVEPETTPTPDPDPPTDTDPVEEPEKTTTVTKTDKVTSVVGRTVTQAATTTIVTDIEVTTTAYQTKTVTATDVATATEVVFVTVTVTEAAAAKRTVGPRATPALDLARRAAVTVDVVQTVVVTKDTTITDFDVVRSTKTHVKTITKDLTTTKFENAEQTITQTSTITETFKRVNTGVETITNTETLPPEVLTSIQPTTESTTETAVIGAGGGSGNGGGSGGSSSGLSTGAKAGIGAGAGVVALLAIAGIIVFIRQKRKGTNSKGAPAWQPDGYHDAAMEPTIPSISSPGHGYPPAVAYMAEQNARPSPSVYSTVSPSKSPFTGAATSVTPVGSSEVDGAGRNTRNSIPMSEMSGETAAERPGQQGMGIGRPGQASTASELDSTRNPHPASEMPAGAGGAAAWTPGHGRGGSQDATELDSMMRNNGAYGHGRNGSDGTDLGGGHNGGTHGYSDAPPSAGGQRVQQDGQHGHRQGWSGGPIDERYEMM
ncbi:hypothetical protein MKZ38_001025 [Zalerion maritima]|uniref:Uncharacterized protein n=1 Tax=Zalerion maritima TaxID=339359 RepID=A0AAD5RQU8_9PEZI|nr:hypothetical protein MKZ38_001025 [Zalerion maritima]